MTNKMETMQKLTAEKQELALPFDSGYK